MAETYRVYLPNAESQTELLLTFVNVNNLTALLFKLFLWFGILLAGSSVYSLFVGERGRVRSGIGLARLVQGGEIRPRCALGDGPRRAPPLVSRFLSVTSLISCLSCISCLLCELFPCFCSLSVLSCLCLLLCLSVLVSVSVPVCVCLYVCQCLSLPVCSCEEFHNRKFSEGGWLSVCVCVRGISENYRYYFYIIFILIFIIFIITIMI